jgi:two-component system response regulator AtoC
LEIDMLFRIALAVKDKAMQNFLERRFALADVRVEMYGRADHPWQRIIRSGADVIVINSSFIPPPIETGIEVLNELPEKPTTVILHEGVTPEEHARLVASGADVALDSQISKKSMAEAIETVLQSREQFVRMNAPPSAPGDKPRIDDFVSNSDAMKMFIEEVRPVVSGNSPLLLLGETGVGKEHLARAIHAESPRAAGPFVTVNAAALSEQLLESELFGHTQGAFTGAVRSRRGAFEMAHRGTILLDEIGEMPLHLQAKLLRVLQDYEVKPVGAESPIWVDVRVVAATNRDLEEDIRAKTFRQDLFYRLSVITLTLPPLRQRREDIPAMAMSFLEHFNQRMGREIVDISEETMTALCRYEWPGNVRELMNVIERAVILCGNDIIAIDNLPHAFRTHLPENTQTLGQNVVFENWSRKKLSDVLRETQDYVERRYLEMVLSGTQGRVGKAAKIAGLDPRGLYNKMKRLGLAKEQFKR